MILEEKAVPIYGYCISGIRERRSGRRRVVGALFRLAGPRIGRVAVVREEFWPL